MEFGAKYDVIIDGNGHAWLEKVSFDPYSEGTVLKDVVERYRERTGHYPRRVFVDRAYRTREDRAFCEERGIEMSGRRPCRPPEDGKERRRAERKNDVDCTEVEWFFSFGKCCCGAGLVKDRFSETALGRIALAILVANLFGIRLPLLFSALFSRTR